MYVKAQYCRNAGLGNKLFPWARAIVIADKYNLKMIDPIWFSPRGASIIRGGINYKKALKKIWLFDNFQMRKNDISYCRSIVLKGNSFEIVNDLEDAFQILDSTKNMNLCFKWNSCHNFSDLYEYRSKIYENLIKITKNESLKYLKKYEAKKYIGLNIRTGLDFVKINSQKNGYYLTDIEWFIMALKAVREKVGDLPAIVVSDGGVKELGKILAQPNIELLNSQNAIEDLLVLSNSDILLGSGNSTFSAWASFLGGMNTYSSSDTPFSHFKIAGINSEQIIGTL